MKFSNYYLSLGEQFYHKNNPTHVKHPELFLFNTSLAKKLQLSKQELKSPQNLANIFSGNSIPCSSTPISLVYAGHQFGHFSPQLGDGRAHLLGELTDKDEMLWEIQLKGSGPSRFSRNGDGRCGLGPALREYIMSEALHAMRIPTTRTLAVVKTGEPVYRESILEGAVVTRVARSHIRVGSFQYFAAQGDVTSLKLLADMAIQRHFSELLDQPNIYLALLKKVIIKHINLIVEWLRVGFIHGVMNTDNALISGDTIDYGPCAMMGVYDPDTVFSSIDRQGRYAFIQQPNIAQWNMTRFAECLLPLINDDTDTAIDDVKPLIESMAPQFKQSYFQMYAEKLGFSSVSEAEIELIQQLLTIMQQQSLDYTITFNALAQVINSGTVPKEIAPLSSWVIDWQILLKQNEDDIDAALQLMQHSNPIVIPRNHHVESILQQCELLNSSEPALHFLKAIKSPYKKVAETEFYQDTSQTTDEHYQTFCGT